MFSLRRFAAAFRLYVQGAHAGCPIARCIKAIDRVFEASARSMLRALAYRVAIGPTRRDRSVAPALDFAGTITNIRS